MNRVFSTLLLTAAALFAATCGDSGPCPEGEVANIDMGVCVPLSSTCADTSDGSVAGKCAAIHRACTGSGQTMACGSCLTGFVAPQGVCRPVATCASLGCAALGETCTEADSLHDATCGDCLPGLIQAEVGCAQPSCDAMAPGSVAASCEAAQRTCVSDSAGVHCGDCFAGLAEDSLHNCKAVVTCSQLNCASLKRVCNPESTHDDAACGNCYGGYVEVMGVCQPVPNATCAAAPAPGSILDSCNAQNRSCVTGATVASCGACQNGYVEDPVTGKCLLQQDCATAHCDTLHRDCSSTPTGHCTTCSAGYVQDSKTGLCRAMLTCNDVICAADEQCTPPVVDPVNNVTTDAVCHDFCPIGTTLWNGRRCEPCPPCDKPSENGPETVPTSGGYCICKTKPGYFYSLGGNIGTFACDADNDGWVRESARSALTSADPVLRQNAHCDVRTLKRFQLFGESTAPVTVPLQTPVPLYETDRNDDDALLKGYWALHGLVSYTGATRDMTAAELNRLTKICHDPKNDYNDNGVPDVSEYPDQQLSPTLLAEQRVFNLYSYFIELDWGAYLSAPGGAATVTVTAGSPNVTGSGFSRSWIGQQLVDGATVLGTIAWVTDSSNLVLSANAAASFTGAPVLKDFAEGTYVIHERTRHTGPPEQDIAAVPIDYGPNNGTYWRDCTVKQDTQWNTPVNGADHTVGMELQGLSDASGNPVTSGMNHHSQFKCTVIGDADPAHPEVKSWDSLKADKYVLDTCKGVYTVANPGNASGTTMHCSPTYDPSIVGGPTPPVGAVVWGAVPYSHYTMAFDQPNQVAVYQPDPAPRYVRGCVNECEWQLPVCETQAKVTATAGNPGAASCNENVANFGKFTSCTITEMCDGVDNNGNGVKDESFPTKGQACDSGICQSDKCRCKPGTWVCKNAGTPSAAPFCQANLTKLPSETCNGLDDDCDDIIDNNVANIGQPCTTSATACNGGPCVGACKNGTWACDLANATPYCVPAQPKNEDCVSGSDLNCNGVLYDAPAGNCGGAFSQFLPDQDRDGYPAQSSTPVCLCNDTTKRPADKSYYTVRQDNIVTVSHPDTCDACTDGTSNTNAALVHYSSTAIAFKTTVNCCGNYDWNSDGQQEQQYQAIGSDSCHYSAGCGSNSTTGWVQNAVPACGASASFDNGGCHYDWGAAKCFPDQSTYTQGCR